MARQRFVHPSMWTDKTFGSLRFEERILFVALFSNADDDGRLVANAGVLRGIAFAYDDFTLRKVGQIRDSLGAKMPNVWLYTNAGEEYVALLKWEDFQKPQYRKSSKLPSPFHEGSMNVHGRLMEDLHRGLGLDLDRDGMGRAVEPSTTSRAKNAEQPSDFQIPPKALRAVQGGAA